MMPLGVGLYEKALIDGLVEANPGLTTPELADALGESVTFARWAVYECRTLEFDDGNHIRFKAGVKIGAEGEEYRGERWRQRYRFRLE